ncbi:sensor histidine kinase [Acaryochloris thomasi]|nr:HAMP domain-containing sensor histidine kinase [Acaryochloris thomasi]
MASILAVFGAGVYSFFSRRFYRQIDQQLTLLAQAAAPSLSDIERSGSQYLDRVPEVPWRNIFNRDYQSLEWFSASGELLASKGKISSSLPPRLKSQDLTILSERPLKVRMYTISVHSDTDTVNEPLLRGYIRASQSTEEVKNAQKRLVWGLGMGGGVALCFVGVGGLWLTERALQPIEQSFRRLKQFTADASHELRSPLTVIKTSAEVMLNHPERVHPKDARKLAAIVEATGQINHLVEDLLFLARTDAVATCSSVQDWMPVQLDQVLREQTVCLEESAQAKGITLQSQNLIPMLVVGDAHQLRRLFSNLLRNALQYTPGGGTVTLSVARQNQTAIVMVEDTGVGIDRDHFSLIFDRFWRAESARTSRKGGMGLGLAIAKSIANVHQGKITLTSKVGVGSCFRVHLPAVQFPRRRLLNQATAVETCEKASNS